MVRKSHKAKTRQSAG
ncbi:hypothetical protein YPPY100_4805, partial [Yersinia pestis PY-100]